MRLIAHFIEDRRRRFRARPIDTCGAILGVWLLAVGCDGGTSGPDSVSPAFQFVVPVEPSEGVFAYSRISPDGRSLAYAAEVKDASQPRGLARVIRVVDVASKEVVFTEPGIDPYWSDDGGRMIYLSTRQPAAPSVTIRNHQTGEITRDVAPVALGDYYSWGVRDGRDLILTIRGNYYYLTGDRGQLPAASLVPCPGLGSGERPLLSRDGARVTVFVDGALVVRALEHCDGIIRTGIPGAKADFSWDGRYIAFHVSKTRGIGYDIQVLDLEALTVRTITSSLAGSSFFPSWTRDGRLSFRYDGPEYRGFVLVDDVLKLPAAPLASQRRPYSGDRVTWQHLFPEATRPPGRVTLMMVWGTWSAHAPDALSDLQRAATYFADAAADIDVLTATDPASHDEDVAITMSRHDIVLPRLRVSQQRVARTGIQNQNPTNLIFRDGVLVDRRLGPMSFTELTDWVRRWNGTPSPS